jgi:PAS domain S-box-containing protein
MPDGIQILHVDDEQDFADLTATYLEREDSRFTVETARSAADGLDRLTERTDCVISDYDMPDTNGIDFLETVRDEYPDLPFILFTGKGSEEVASDAISAGVTDYLQKASSADQYTVLANRVTNAVAQARAEQRLQEERRRFRILFERLTQPTVEVEYEDGDPIVRTVNTAFEDVFGYDASEIVGNSLDAYVIPEGEDEEASRINQRVRAGDGFDSLEVTRRTADGNREFLLQSAGYDDGSGGFTIYTDITERKRRERRLEAQRQQLRGLLDATRTLMTADTRDEIAARASDTARDVFDLPLNAIYLHDRDRDALVPTAVTDAVDEEIGDLPEVGPGDGVAWTAYETREAQVSADSREAPGVTDPESPIRSECHIPFGEHGVLVAASTGTDTLTETEVTSAKILAAHLEVAFDRADRVRRQQEYLAALRTLHETTQTFMTAPDQQTVASHAVETAQAVLDQPINGIWLYDGNTKRLEPVASTDEQREVLDGMPAYDEGESLPWKVFETGEVRIHDSSRSDPDRHGPETPLASKIVLPLGDVGVMNLGATEPRAFNDIDISLAQIFADIVETALARADHEQKLARSRELLRHTENLAGTGGWEIDAETGTQRWTQGTYAIHDIPPDSEFEPTVDAGIQFYHSDDRNRIEQVVSRCLEHSESYDEELRLITAEDRQKWVRTTGEPVTENGSVTAVRGAIQDITERKQQEHQLERKHARLSVLFEQFPEPTLAYTYENGESHVRQVNEAFVETFGYDAKEAVGRPINDLIVPPDRKEEAARLDKRVEAGEMTDKNLRRQARDGLREFRFRNIPLPDDDSIDGYAIYTDVTDRKRREEQLRQEQQRFQTLFQQLTQPLVEVEYDGLDPIVTDVNPAFEETFGYDAATIVGNSLDEHIVPDDFQDEATEINEHVRGGGQLVSREVTRQTTDELREFLLENAVYEDGSGGFAVYTDISERKRREKALNALHNATREFIDAKSKEAVANRAVRTTRTVLDQPINGLWLYDPDDDALQPAAMTEDAEELFGYQPTYIGSESLSWQAFEDGTLRVYDDVRTEPERLRGETSIRNEMIVPLGDHGVMNIGATEPRVFSEIDVSLARILGKTIESALTSAEREQRLRRQQAQLERQNERLEQFAGVVSHDLRNPLNVAMARLELLSEECNSEHLGAMTRALDRIDRIVDDVLWLARQGQDIGELEPVDLDGMVRNAWSIAADTYEGSELVVDAPDGLGWIEADSDRLSQLLENLLGNAVEHGGESVTVTVGSLDDGFHVEDDGQGIPPEKRDTVFEAGYTTADQGTGFGLSIVEQIAEAHGWEVDVVGGSEGGARFEITGVTTVD